MKKIPDIINRLWKVCGQMEVGALLTCGSGIMTNNEGGNAIFFSHANACCSLSSLLSSSACITSRTFYDKRRKR